MAKPSALEGALVDAGHAISAWVRVHDRAVVVALLLSLIPVPPACWFGVLLTVVNLTLLKLQRLSNNEAKTVYVTLVIGAVNSIIGYFLVHAATSAISDTSLSGVLELMPGFVRDYFRYLAEFIGSVFGGGDAPDWI